MNVCLRLTHPTPGIEPGGRMRCAINSRSFVLVILDRLSDADIAHNLTTRPRPGIEPAGRMMCAISSKSSVSATLDTRPR